MNNDNNKIKLLDLGFENFDYSIPEEGACSPEFPSGCILCDES